MDERVRPELSVVVPVHDEADNIEPLVREIRAALSGRAFEIIYVDDASRDATLSELRRVQREFAPELRVVEHAAQAGQSTALYNGVAAARSDWVATLDGDGQNDPADIPKLWQAVQDAGPDDAGLLAIGHRQRRDDSWLRRVSSRVANGVRGRLLGDRCPDTGCGLKLFRRSLFMDLPYFDHMHRFLPALVRQAGGRSLSVPVHHRPRERGDSKYGVHNRLWVGLVDLCGVFWLGRRNRRVRIKNRS